MLDEPAAEKFKARKLSRCRNLHKKFRSNEDVFTSRSNFGKHRCQVMVDRPKRHTYVRRDSRTTIRFRGTALAQGDV